MAGITSTKKIKGQKHFLAYITPSEAEILEKSGGKKTMTKEGVPAYPPSNDARGESRGSGPEANNSGGSNDYEDQSYSNPSFLQILLQVIIKTRVILIPTCKTTWRIK